MTDATAALPDGVAAVFPFDQPVWGVVSVGDMIWVEAHDGTLRQLDGATGEELTRIDGYGPFIADGTLWFRRDDTLVAADPVTGEDMVSYTPPGLGPGAVVDGEYWTATEDRKLFRIDLETNEILRETSLPFGEPKWVEAWAGAIWVVIDGLNVVVRVEPDTGDVLEVNAGSRPHSVATGFGSLWVTEHGAAQLLRISPTGEIEDTIAGVGINVAIAVGGDHIWAATPTGMAKVDPATNEVVDEIELGAEEWYAATASQGSVWLTSPTDNSLYQLPIY